MQTKIATNGKLIITVAPTSGIHGKETNPNLPESPDEIVEEVCRAREAGASIAHIHIRDNQRRNRVDLDVYGEVITRIRERCDILIELDNIVGMGWDAQGKPVALPFEERLRLLNVEPRPDMMMIMVGAFTSTAGGFGERHVINPTSFIQEYVEGCNKRGIGVEFEINDVSHIYTVMDLASQGAVQEPIRWTFMLRGGKGLPPMPDHIMHILRCLPENSTWQFVGLGKYQLPISALAMTLGGRVRVGMEDNVYYSRGVLAGSNAQLVQRISHLAAEMGYDLANPSEARAILRLKSS